MNPILFALYFAAAVQLPALAQSQAAAQSQALAQSQAAAQSQALAQSQTFPSADFTNGIVSARVYLPDTATGYYRSTRFDWSGVMPRLEYAGHSYFGQWFPKYDPLINDAIQGPVESFDPLGYDQAAPGASFIKIGIGALIRPDAKPYSAFKYYHILDVGKWEVKKSRAAIEFRHRLNHKNYGYVYTKKMTLTRGRPELVITHTLKNTGHDPIVTDVFDHNFFMLDSQSVAPGRVLKFSFSPTAEEARGLGSMAAIQDDSIVTLRPLTGQESYYAILHGYGDSEKDYDIRLEDHPTGAAVHITADRPLSRLVFWGSVNVMSPEPYIHVSVEPGQTFTWTIRYEFYTLNPR
jgi:hypothetical protein